MKDILGSKRLLVGRNDQVLSFLLKNKISHNGVKPGRSRSARRSEFDTLYFMKNGFCMLPEMSFVHFHKQAKKWQHGAESAVCTTSVAC